MRILGKFPKTRLRRVRNSDWIRRLVSENNLSTDDLIYPIFLIEGKNKIQKIKSMDGINRYTIDKLDPVIEKCLKYKSPMISIFPYIPNFKRDERGTEALNENNLVCKAINHIKKKYKDIGVMSDVALDPYTSHGHDGVILNGQIDNDKSLDILIKQALLQAQMGCDVIAPSDMMDGRVGLIRKNLDKKGLIHTKILSYAVKYSSNFYGPFREAIGTNLKLKGDKKTYQMDFRNSKEALREVGLDIKEGADFVMVKPGMPYLDIIKLIKDNFKIPVFAYQVSGEYSMIKNSVTKNILNKDAIIESLISFKRSGASGVITYFALEAAKILKSQA